ncbi:hypothetical protein GQ607_014806 [Colletotrichum asianum]|uniref:Uncharacterized protein n=1 Tax=Colletotrichum asianum TaxID=702518 RepID=A0A8H3VWS5_9PEZI|nr:hypothetical protein GQ607_014806 [Colletotrichum asianum]
MANRDNQSGANSGRLNFIDAYPHTAAPTADVVSAFINDTITPAAAVRPQAASRAAASLLASVEGHGRQLHAHLRENPSVAAKDISAVATQAAKMLAAELAVADAEAEEAAAQRMLALYEAEIEEAAAEAEVMGLMQDAEERYQQQQQQHGGEEEEEEEEETEASRRNNDAFLDFRYDARDDYNPLFGDDNDIPLRDHNIPLAGDEPHGSPAPSSDDDPFRSSPARPAVRSAPGAVRSRPESDSESDAPPRQRRRTISVSSDRDSDSDSDSDSEGAPQPPPARRVRRPRAPPANQEEELNRIAQRVYDTTMSQLRQGTFTSRMRLADRQDIAWHARAAVLDTAVAQEEGIAEPNNEPRAGRASEDELSSEYDEELVPTPPVRRTGTMFTSLIFNSDDE